MAPEFVLCGMVRNLVCSRRPKSNNSKVQLAGQGDEAAAVEAPVF